MNVAVIGATGATGMHLTRTLLERGHQVTALVRDPGRLGDLTDRFRVVQGTSTDPAAIRDLLAGNEAVISALGPTKKEASLHQDTARVLVEAMRREGIRRFIGISGAGIDVTGDRKAAKDKVISYLIQRLGGAVVADKPAEHRIWSESGLDWTLVRPPRLTNGPATGHLEHHAHDSTRSSTLPRADLGAFLVDVLEQHLYEQSAPFVAQAKQK